jgi:type IV pilus assembly protein PilF
MATTEHPKGHRVRRAAAGCRLPLLLLIVGLAACANQARLQERAANHIHIGSAYLGTAQYNGALKELQEAEKLTPDDPKLHFLLGIAYHGKGLDDRAIAEFKKAIELKPDGSEVHNFLGVIYLERGRWDEAIVSFNNALANVLYDTPATALYNLGRAYYEKKMYDPALKNLQDAVTSEPYTVLMPLIEKNMGMVWFAKGDTEEACRHFLKSLELAPSLAESHYRLGLCYRKLNRQEDATTAFQTAARLAPDSEFGRLAREQLR